MEAYELIGRIVQELRLPIKVDVVMRNGPYSMVFSCGECGVEFYRNGYQRKPPRADLEWFGINNMGDVVGLLERMRCHPVARQEVSLARMTREILDGG